MLKSIECNHKKKKKESYYIHPFNNFVWDVPYSGEEEYEKNLLIKSEVNQIMCGQFKSVIKNLDSFLCRRYLVTQSFILLLIF